MTRPEQPKPREVRTMSPIGAMLFARCGEIHKQYCEANNIPVTDKKRRNETIQIPKVLSDSADDKADRI